MTGPIKDEQGLEQGGLPSSDCYKLYNNKLLDQAQQSSLGVELSKDLIVSAVGQADDTALLSDDLLKLLLILQLALDYCEKYNVELSPSKTKLMQIVPPRKSTFVPYNPIKMFNKCIDFVEQAEHVGVLRSSDGNLPNLLQMFASFKKALGSIISCGLARRSRSNPSASLRILSLYGTPVLMSGLASLVLSPKEISSVDQQFKGTVQALLKLSISSPAPLVHFVSGTLPGTAILHLRQLSLFGMICHLPGDPLHHQAQHVLLTSSSVGNSWFIQVRKLFLQYSLPHPLLFLSNPPQKEVFKKLVKSKVTDYWENKLRMEASFLPSLEYFHPEFMSLSIPHKLLTSAGSKSYEVAKARIQLLCLANQYPSSKNTRHWSTQNPDGLCSFPVCQEQKLVESSEHILLCCTAKLYSMCLGVRNPYTYQLITRILFSRSPNKMMQFLVDSSALPEVIHAVQLYGESILKDLFYLSRTWCFSLHRLRMRRLGKWNFR